MFFTLGATDCTSVLEFLLPDWCRVHSLLCQNNFKRIWQGLSWKIWKDVEAKAWLRMTRISNFKAKVRQRGSVCNDNSDSLICRIWLDFPYLPICLLHLLHFRPNCPYCRSKWQNRLRWYGRQHTLICLSSHTLNPFMLSSRLHLYADLVQWDRIYETNHQIHHMWSH